LWKSAALREDKTLTEFIIETMQTRLAQVDQSGYEEVTT